MDNCKLLEGTLRSPLFNRLGFLYLIVKKNCGQCSVVTSKDKNTANKHNMTRLLTCSKASFFHASWMTRSGDPRHGEAQDRPVQMLWPCSEKPSNR